MTRYTTDSSILSCFPRVLRNAIGAKALSGVSAASSGNGMLYDKVSNGGVADKLWLFSYGEMTSAVYPDVCSMIDDGVLFDEYSDFGAVDDSKAVAPGFTLPSTGL